MRRGTKTIKPETSPIAGGTQRTPADQARAKQWCRLFIRIDVGDMKAEMSVGNGMGRIASVSRTSGKAGRVAQILTPGAARSEEHTSELQSLMRISYAVFCLNKNIQPTKTQITT